MSWALAIRGRVRDRLINNVSPGSSDYSPIRINLLWYHIGLIYFCYPQKPSRSDRITEFLSSYSELLCLGREFLKC